MSRKMTALFSSLASILGTLLLVNLTGTTGPRSSVAVAVPLVESIPSKASESAILSVYDLGGNADRREEITLELPAAREDSFTVSYLLTDADLLEIKEGLGPDWGNPIPDNAEANGEYLAGLPHGVWSLYYPHKDVTDTGRFILGARSGAWQVFDKAGNLLRERIYVAGKLEGPFRDRDSASEPWNTYHYSGGEIVPNKN